MQKDHNFLHLKTLKIQHINFNLLYLKIFHFFLHLTHPWADYTSFSRTACRGDWPLSNNITPSHVDFFQTTATIQSLAQARTSTTFESRSQLLNLYLQGNRAKLLQHNLFFQIGVSPWQTNVLIQTLGRRSRGKVSHKNTRLKLKSSNKSSSSLFCKTGSISVQNPA